ncbi:hypothetical protein ABEB36_001244 [Hypothenemus hampei]|uniref:BTB domain-containing protein n=1 Tax=Hypothenemus hampei TaxID=57062 RepID=A0ABD1FDY9_HYPHA
MMTMQQYCLRWNNHQPNFISVFSSLLNNESLVDVTLAAEGKHLQAHKVVLSACSSYFQTLFTINPCQHPIVILKDVKFLDLKIMVDFMYYGEVNVSQEQLPYILKTAEMLKIKGLAEIPVEQTLSKTHNTSMEKTELLTPQDSNWSSEGVPLQSSTPSPCPLSPGTRRKRLRKSSSGSGSGERPPDCVDTQGNELILGSNSGSILGSVIKTDPGGYLSDSSTLGQKGKQHSGESSDLHRGSSHESGDSDNLHQITLVPQHQQQEVTIGHNTESPPEPLSDLPGSSSVQHQQSPIDKSTVDQILQQNQPPMGTKRGRFLMRQPRIKRESDSSHPSDSDSPALHYLSVPHSARVERQYSDPLPTTMSPPPGNLLAVPGSILVKQHSHPLLPSQVQPPLSPPLHIQLVSHSSAERALSPVVVVSDSYDLSRAEASAEVAPTQILRVRTDELKRSSSSPQASGRSSHCPVIRPGPALGCNYCWNTVDTHGRILRRKTKYHCPECQTNLCIVPCFQEYHERHSTTETDPIALPCNLRKILPKTSSL